MAWHRLQVPNLGGTPGIARVAVLKLQHAPMCLASRSPHSEDARRLQPQRKGFGLGGPVASHFKRNQCPSQRTLASNVRCMYAACIHISAMGFRFRFARCKHVWSSWEPADRQPPQSKAFPVACLPLNGLSDALWALLGVSRAQCFRMREYTFGHVRTPCMIQGVFLKRRVLGSLCTDGAPANGRSGDSMFSRRRKPSRCRRLRPSSSPPS